MRSASGQTVPSIRQTLPTTRRQQPPPGVIPDARSAIRDRGKETRAARVPGPGSRLSPWSARMTRWGLSEAVSQATESSRCVSPGPISQHDVSRDRFTVCAADASPVPRRPSPADKWIPVTRTGMTRWLRMIVATTAHGASDEAPEFAFPGTSPHFEQTMVRCVQTADARLKRQVAQLRKLFIEHNCDENCSKHCVSSHIVGPFLRQQLAAGFDLG